MVFTVYLHKMADDQRRPGPDHRGALPLAPGGFPGYSPSARFIRTLELVGETVAEGQFGVQIVPLAQVSEHPHRLGVKVHACRIPENPHRRVRGHPLAIRPVAGERVEGVRDGDDPAGGGDLLAFETSRVPGAVPALMLLLPTAAAAPMSSHRSRRMSRATGLARAVACHPRLANNDRAGFISNDLHRISGRRLGALPLASLTDSNGAATPESVVWLTFW